MKIEWLIMNVTDVMTPISSDIEVLWAMFVIFDQIRALLTGFVLLGPAIFRRFCVRGTQNLTNLAVLQTH